MQVHISPSLFLTVHENKKQPILREGEHKDNWRLMCQHHVQTAMANRGRWDMSYGLEVFSLLK
jgi:hypothetical protein